jgi:hypothetical protein
MDDELEDIKSRLTLKSIALNVLFVVILAGLVCGAIAYVHWYKSLDHSSYSELTRTTYTKNGLNYSYSYPRLMSSNPTIASKLEGVPAAYTYSDKQGLQAVVAVSHENIVNVLKVLNLTPAQYMTELLTGKGTYITALDSEQGSPNSYAKDFPGCSKQFMTTNSGQKVLLCVNHPPRYINARVIGATKTNQYILELIMLPSVWQAHQKVWQSIEKSFEFK